MIQSYLLLIAILFIVFCFGAIIGSFLNVVILRAFSGESIVLPPSKCPKCQNKLKWWHNIPILSYLLLRGKCYFCHEKISIQYPIIEFVTGLLFVLVFIQYGIMPETFFALVIVSLLIVISVTDIKEQIVFDKHTYALIFVGLVYNFALTAFIVYNQAFNTISGFHLTKDFLLNNPLTLSVLGLILGAVIMEIAARIGNLVAGERAFGEGDTYIAAGLGAAFGWQNVILIIILSVIFQVICLLPLFIKKQISMKRYSTVISLLLLLGSIVVFLLLQHKTQLFNNDLILYLSIFVEILLAVIACINIIKGLKHKDELTYLPFGPALAFSALLVLLVNISIPLF